MIRAFVVNLEREGERRAQIAAQLRALGIPFDVFAAVDGSTLDDEAVALAYDGEAARRRYREMSRGELGCALSHLGVYRRMLDERVGLALVLEDDARLGAGLAEVLQRLEARLSPEEPQVVLLSHVDKYTRWGSEPLGETARLVNRYGHWWRAHGYVITRAAARQMLDALRPVSGPADYWADFEKRGIVQLKAVVPYCIGLSPLAQSSALETHRAQKDAVHRSGRDFGYYLRKYLWGRFLYQIFVRPFLRVARQKRSW